jgi:hypothetical protein
MITVPAEIMVELHHFAPVFSERVWDWAQVLVLGAILAPRERTVCSALRAVGLGQERQFQNYHRVLNRANWLGIEASRILLGLLLGVFVAADGVVLLGADDTLERRRGEKIKAKGHYRDSAKSSSKQSVSSEGLRWMSLMLLAAPPWWKRIWGLPFLTVLLLSPKTSEEQGIRHHTSIDRVRQMMMQVRRWLPGRQLVLVTDGAIVSVKLGLACVQQQVTFVSRLHFNLRFFEQPPPKVKGKPGPTPTLGKRLPTLQALIDHPDTQWLSSVVTWYGGELRRLDILTDTALRHTPSESQPLPIRWVLIRDPHSKFKTAALMSTDLTATPEQIIAWYIARWNLEVTFEEVRAHLGVETQRQWNDLAIERTTPILMGLFSLVTLLAQHLTHSSTTPIPVRQTAWYTKPQPTFADALAFVRTYLWTQTEFLKPHFSAGFKEFPRSLLDDLLQTLAYAR